MWGLSGVSAILGAIAGRKKLEHLQLSEAPNMPFLYWLAVMGAMLKPKWTASKKWPALKVSYTAPRKADPQRLAAFRKLAGWGAGAAGAPGQLPSLFLMAEGFKLVMSVLTLPAFPVSILGTVVNKKAKYSLLRGVGEGERLLYSARLVPSVRETFSGHAEFDIVLEAASADRGDVVWQAVLSLVLMNPKKSKGGHGGKKEAAEAESGPEAESLDVWTLPEDTGRRYAALDGDISPMHLYKATAMLMGFPSPVANVHLLGARTEASLAAKKGAAAVAAPFSLDVEFKKPTLLPNKLTLSAAPGGQGFSEAAAGAEGYRVRVEDKRGKPILVAAARKKAERV
ncbi:acyl dehydratase [Raphidocelis subcapitata]|uniref:Acyl dehydratase n=1 Tax=Raphidocelis subcapitata TaxID=307507 RepID=A0A2V0NZM1_9CHLO|nr:acyl dehydratase [Raphidocelis subcapitata]|eukprot:GBF93066.1 acyl dehydratase [Raphidocelis subcapitata]